MQGIESKIEVRKLRKLEFRSLHNWGNLQELARKVLELTEVPADAIIYLSQNRVDVEGQW